MAKLHSIKYIYFFDRKYKKKYRQNNLFFTIFIVVNRKYKLIIHPPSIDGYFSEIKRKWKRVTYSSHKRKNKHKTQTKRQLSREREEGQIE